MILIPLGQNETMGQGGAILYFFALLYLFH